MSGRVSLSSWLFLKIYLSNSKLPSFRINFRKSPMSFSKKSGICIRIAHLVFRLGEVRGFVMKVLKAEEERSLGPVLILPLLSHPTRVIHSTNPY